MRKNYTVFNFTSLFLLLLSIFYLAGSFPITEMEVEFKDPGLELAVRNAIDKDEGDILPDDVDLLQELDASGYSIKNLDGIEYLEELKVLNLEDNYIESVSPLKNLIKLEELNLRNNEITSLEEIDFDDIIFLNIRDLSLRHNVKRDAEGNDTRLSDVTLLGHMTSLEDLDLRDNHVEELSPLSNLRDLKDLDLRENKFESIEALEALVNLESLNLRDNEIDSLEPIKNLTKLEYLNIHSNSSIVSLEPISNLVYLETLIMPEVPIEDDGKFLRNLTSLQRLNVIDTGLETVDLATLEYLQNNGALQGEVRPVRILHTLDAPVLSEDSGFYEEEFELKISTDAEKGNIYYTLDGSEPTLNSALYTEPIHIEKNNENSMSVVRAKVLSEDNAMSKTVTKSYFIHNESDNRFDLPVISLVTNPDNFFDEEIGIYTEDNMHNRGKDWERPVHLDFFESDGNIAFTQELGIRLHGGVTRGFAQKSLRIYARSEYDESGIMIYDFFNNREKMNGKGYLKNFKTLILRNSGNEWRRSMFSDALMQSLVAPLGTVDTQAYQPAVVFLNGKYYGIYNIRERLDEYYLNTHYDINTDDLVILEQNGQLSYGDNKDTYHYSSMLKFIKENGLETEENYEHIKTMIDTDNFRDYFASQIYFGNADWPHNNIEFWRKNTEKYEKDAPYGHDGRWRWMLFDTDFGFYSTGNNYGDKDYPLNHLHNTIDWVMDEFDGHRGSRRWPNFLFRSMMSNNKFKIKFLNRMNDLLNSYFESIVVTNRIDNIVANIENEMPIHINRWKTHESVDEWIKFVDTKYYFANERPEILRGYIMEEFDIEDTVIITLTNENEMGHIRLNTIDINSDLPGNTMNETWEGTYFKNVPVTLEAVPKEGYKFSHWEGIDEINSQIEITPSNDLTIKAVFTEK